jgi:tetratricopeptide (TPR) repeat protein
VVAAAALGLKAAGDADSIAARLLSWLRESPRSWLVVFDDLREAATLDGLWPDGPAGRVLVTATSLAAAGRRAGGETTVIPIGTFSRRESLAYLMGRLTSDLDQRTGAADLIDELGDEPLAIVAAASAIASSELSCRSYVGHLTARRGQGPAEGASPAALTWALSVEHAQMLAGPIANELLTVASLLDGSGAPYQVFMTAGRQNGVPGPTLKAGLDALEAAGLLTIDRTVDLWLVRINWVVQAAVRAAAGEAALMAVANVATGALLADWPADDKPEWLARAFRSCTDSVRRLAGDALLRDGCHPLLLRAGRSLDAIPAPSVSVDYWTELAGACDRLLGGDHPDTREVSGRLARAHLAAGQPAEALPWLQWVRGERTSRLGPDALATADASRDFGTALMASGRAAEAATLLGDAVTAYERMIGADSMQSLETRDDMITALHLATRLPEAIALGKRTLADRERIQGQHHPDTLSTAARLANAYVADGQAKAATLLLRLVVALREKVPGPRHPDTIAARALLASAYHAAGKMGSAVQLYEQVREEYAQVFGSDHRLTLGASLNLAHALQGVGRITEAVKLLQETARRCDLRLPAGDPLTASAREGLRNLTSGETVGRGGEDGEDSSSATTAGTASAEADAPDAAAAGGPADGGTRFGFTWRMPGRHRTAR